MCGGVECVGCGGYHTTGLVSIESQMKKQLIVVAINETFII